MGLTAYAQEEKAKREAWYEIRKLRKRIAELEKENSYINMHGEVCAHELEDANKRIAKFELKQRGIIRDIKVCFGYAVACDGNLLVNADAYNLLVATCNAGLGDVNYD